MRHGQAVSNNFITPDVYHNAPGLAVLPPPFVDIGLADAGDISRLPVLQNQAVQMTSVFSGQYPDERRKPKWLETVALTRPGQATQQGVYRNGALPN